MEELKMIVEIGKNLEGASSTVFYTWVFKEIVVSLSILTGWCMCLFLIYKLVNQGLTVNRFWKNIYRIIMDEEHTGEIQNFEQKELVRIIRNLRSSNKT